MAKTGRPAQSRSARGARLDEGLLGAGRLCVVGNVNRDVRTAPFAASDTLLSDGETSVDGICETIGGGGANCACAAAALGARVGLLGKVGADALGERLATVLARHGVNASLARDPRCQTGTSLALFYADGQRHFLSCQPNNASLDLADLDLRVLPGYRHLYRADIWFSERMLFGGNARLFAAARQAGLTVSIDVNWDPGWGTATAAQTDRRQRAVRDVLPLVDIVHGNVRELNRFTGASELSTSLSRLVDWGSQAAVVHMGADGAGWYARGRLTVVPACRAERRVNVGGTGDVLSACMMLLPGDVEPIARLQLANQVVAQYIEGRRLIPRLA